MATDPAGPRGGAGDPSARLSATFGPGGHAFEVHGCLGRGGFGEVYHATMSTAAGVRRVVAVKTLRSDVDPNGDAVRRLRDEARLVAAVRHPAVVQVHDLVILDGRVALVTEYVDGQDLAELAVERALPLRPLIAVVGEVASVLEVVFWSPGPDGVTLLQIVHRDVKPANIRVGRHAEVKLLDFGIARASMEREAETQTNVALGSLSYMAPERFRTDRVEPPSDVYALGCTLFVCLTGRGMFEDASPQTVWKTMFDPEKCRAYIHRRLQALPESVPVPVRELIAAMLSPDPAARPSAGEVALTCEALEEQLEGPSLKRWCQDRAWPDLRYVKGSLDPGERDLTAFEAAPSIQDPAVTTVLSMPPSPAFSPSELGIARLTDAEFDELVAEPTRRRRLALALVASLCLAAVAAAVWWSW